jgi:hypothetical protein
MKNLLVPYNPNVESEVFLQNIVTHFNKPNYHIHILHLVDKVFEVSKIDSIKHYLERSKISHFLNELKEDSDLQNKEILELVKQLEKNSSCLISLHFYESNRMFYDKIFNSFIDTYNMDAVFVFSQGIDSVNDYLLGTNAQKLIRSSKCSIFIFTDINYNNKGFLSEIIILIDVFDFTDLSLIKGPHTDVFNLVDKIKILYINTPKHFSSTSQIQSAFDNITENVNYNTELVVYNAFSIEDGVADFTNDFDVGFLLLKTNDRGGLKRLFNAHSSEDIIYTSKIPVCVLK